MLRTLVDNSAWQEFLRADRELFASFRTTHTKAEHDAIERRWNDARARIVEHRQYLRDRRGEFSCRVLETDSRRVVAITGSVTCTSDTIDWRKHSAAGAKHDANVRRDLSKRTGEDSGHLIALRFGADPELIRRADGSGFEPNLTLQRSDLNRGRGWGELEGGLAKYSADKKTDLAIELRSVQEKDLSLGQQRETFRTMSARTPSGGVIEIDTHNGKLKLDEHTIHVNWDSPARRTAAHSLEQTIARTPRHT